MIYYKNKIYYFKKLLLNLPFIRQYPLNIIIYFEYNIEIYLIYIDNITNIMYIFIYNDLS